MIDFFCLVYYVCSSIELIPAIVRMFIRKSSHDYSRFSAALGFTSCVAWSLYIYLTEQTVLVYIGTALDIVWVTIYTIAVFAFWKREPNEETNHLQT